MSITKKLLGRLLSAIHLFRRLPGMTPLERKKMKAIFSLYKGKHLRVLEWGCGSSTIYYAKYLRSLGIDFEWYAIDNSKEWHSEVSKKIKQSKLDDNVKLFLFEFVPFWLKSNWKWGIPSPKGFGPEQDNENKYINFPKTLEKNFDIIIVDGRFRRRCLIEAKDLLAPNGYIVLHDAHNKHYHSPLSLYKYGKFLDSEFIGRDGKKLAVKMWVGSNEKEALPI